MRYKLGLALAIASLVALPALAAQSSTAKPAAKPATTTTKAKDASHATTGVVKMMDANTLVISHSKGKDMTFALNASTQKDASVAVGSNVSVRYHEEGKSMVATAVMVQPAKSTATTTKTTTKK